MQSPRVERRDIGVSVQYCRIRHLYEFTDLPLFSGQDLGLVQALHQSIILLEDETREAVGEKGGAVVELRVAMIVDARHSPSIQ